MDDDPDDPPIPVGDQGLRSPRFQRAIDYGRNFGNFLASTGGTLSFGARAVGSGVSFTGKTLYNASGTKTFYQDEDFESYQKKFLTYVILICVIFIILSIMYMVKIINGNRRVLKNKDKNEKIIKNLFVK